MMLTIHTKTPLLDAFPRNWKLHYWSLRWECWCYRVNAYERDGCEPDNRLGAMYAQLALLSPPITETMIIRIIGQELWDTWQKWNKHLVCNCCHACGKDRPVLVGFPPDDEGNRLCQHCLESGLAFLHDSEAAREETWV